MAKAQAPSPESGHPFDGNEASLTIMNAQDYMHQLLQGIDVPFDYDEIMSVLVQVPDDQLEEISSDYWKPEVGHVYNMCVTGFETKDIKGRSAECMIFLDEKRNRYITAATVLVGNAKQLTTFPGYLRVKCTGKTKAKEGEYFEFEVRRIKQD